MRITPLLASNMGRCEPTIDSECGDACAGDFMLSDVSAIPEALEVIQLCAARSGDGPPSTASPAATSPRAAQT